VKNDVFDSESGAASGTVIGRFAVQNVFVVQGYPLQSLYGIEKESTVVFGLPRGYDIRPVLMPPTGDITGRLR